MMYVYRYVCNIYVWSILDDSCPIMEELALLNMAIQKWGNDDHFIFRGTASTAVFRETQHTNSYEYVPSFNVHKWWHTFIFTTRSTRYPRMGSCCHRHLPSLLIFQRYWSSFRQGGCENWLCQKTILLETTRYTIGFLRKTLKIWGKWILVIVNLER